MAQQDDNIKKLYDELQSTYDVGSEDDFRNYLNNAEHRKALYNELKNDYDIQDEKAFDDYLGYGNGEKTPGTTKVGSAAQQVVNEYDQSVKDNANNNNQSAPEDLSAATAGAKIGGNISLTPVKANNQQAAQPAVDNTAKSVMGASGTPAEQTKVTGPKTQFVSEDPNYVQATPTAEALKKYPWMQPDQAYLWNKTTKEPVVTYVDESGQAVTDEDLQIKKAKSEITGQDDTEYMYPEAAALQLPNGNTTGLKIKKGALTQMADEILRKEYGDNYLNTQFSKDGNVYTGAERRDLGAQQLYDELNSDVRNARISFAVADEKDRNEILSRIKAKWGKVADANSIINAVNDENAAKRDIDIVAQQNINELNAEIQKISQQMDLRGAEIDNASSPFVDQTFNARDVDPKYRLLQSKLNYAQNALKSWENVKNSGSLNAFSGFKDAIMDISAWDFGFSDLKNSIALLTAKGNDKQELVNLYGRSAEAAKFEDKYNPDTYRYGKIAGASIPFALQFVGTGGGFKSIGSAVSKKATSIAEKYALEGLKKQVVKGLGVVAGDIARAYTMSGTIQGLNTISDILNRSAGELTVDKQGNYQFKSDEPLLKSIYKGVTASAIQNFTEMVGESVNVSANLMRMLPKIGLGRVSNAITKIGAQDWYRVCNNWLSRAGVNDFGGEVLEEEIGIILNAALVGDNPLFNGSGGLLDVRTQKDILGGMLLSISSMRAGALAMYGVKKGVGSAFIKTLDMYDKMQLNQSDKGGQSIFGEGWAAIKDEIDNTPNEKVNAVIEKLAKEHPSKDEQSAIIDYAVKLLKTRGHNLGIAMASDGENDEGAQEEVQNMPDLSQPNAEYLNKDDGMIHKASLYPDASDPTGTAKDVFIIKGNLVTNEDGSINKDASDDTIIYIDGNGERHIASPDKFAAAYPPMSNDEVQQANEGVAGEGTQTTDTFNKGDEVNINVNGNNYTATIQGTDGFGNYNVYYEDENGMMHPAEFTADQLAAMNSASAASNDKQNMIEQLAGNQQQIEQPAQEQVAQQEQPAQEGQKPAIPTDEKGNMLYHQVPVETTINDLYDGSLDDNEIRDFVDANISEANKNLEKVNKKAPKIGTNKAEYLKKKQEWQKQVEDATRIRDYWNSVKDYIAQQTHTTPEEVKVAQDELSGEAARREYQDMGGSVQQDAVSVASDFIRGAKIAPESFKAETGYGTDEQRKFVGMIAKAENGGKTIDRLAEELVSYNNAEMNGVLFGGDTSSAKDAILSALQGAGTRGELKQTNEAEEQAYIDARNAARDAQYMEQYGMTYEEYLAYEEQIMPTIWRDYNNYDETAFTNMYTEEIEQLLNSRENDTTGEERADDRGNQVLSEQQVTEQRGSEGGTKQGTEVQAGVQGTDENAVAQGETQERIIQPVGKNRFGNIYNWAKGQFQSAASFLNNLKSGYLRSVFYRDGIGDIDMVWGNEKAGLQHIIKKHIEEADDFSSVEEAMQIINETISNGDITRQGSNISLDNNGYRVSIAKSDEGNWVLTAFDKTRSRAEKKRNKGNATIGDQSVSDMENGTLASPQLVSSESKDSESLPNKQTVGEKIAKAEEETDVNPTEGQKEAGNYKKGHVRIDGYDITIEQPKGSVRRGTDAEGKKWEQTMNNTYGYIRGTEGVDGDHIDIFLSDDPTTGNVYVIDQINPDGSFDEHKVMYGFNSADEARAAYLSNYEDGWQGLGTITEVSKDEFKKWVESSHKKTKPFAEYKSVNAIGAQNEESADKAMPIQGLQGYSRDEIKNIVKDYIEQKMSDYDIDAEIKGIEIHGSRNRGDARDDSDLDVVFEYEGDIREDDMFNTLNDDTDDEALHIEGIRVDINPIREQETGTLDRYMKRSREYDEEVKAKSSEVVKAKESTNKYGANNKIVSKERYEELKKRMIKKLGQLNFGMDPELLEIGIEMTAYHLEAGARKFVDYAKAMVNDIGDAIRPYLKSLYNAARDYPDVVQAGLNVGMSTSEEVSKFDVTNFDKKTIDALATADNVVKEQNIKKETEKIIKENEKKSEQTAKKSVSSQKIADLFGDINGSTKSDAQRRFSDTVKSDMLSALDRGEKPYRSIVDLRKRASEVGMDVDNEGRSDILLQELVEDGLVGAAREVVNKYGSDSKDSYDLICKLYDMQPTIAARSSNRIKMQQYSTPLPMAWNAAHFALNGKQGGKVLEPTAGNGMLVFAVPTNQVHANELDETRLNNLREQGFAEVTQQDATEPFEGGRQYDAIIANPPFGSRKAIDYDGKMIPGLDPQITLNALLSMKDDGKAAIIIGGNMEYAKNGSIKSMKPFFTYLYDHYNVKGVVDMDGKLYAKQGTTFPTRMILIDGRRSEEERAQTTVYPPVESKAVAKVSSFEELYNTVNDIINSKEKTNGTEILHSREREPLSVNNRPSGDTEGNRRTEQPRKNDTTGRGNKAEGSKEQSERVLPGERRKNTGDGETRNEVAGSEQRGRRGSNEPAVQRVGGERVLTERVGLKEEPKKRSLTEEKLPYRPHNTAFSLNSVAPSAMVEAMDKILTQIEKENGSIDDFVRKELGYDTIGEAHQALAAEQMDSVAMAIYQMKKGQALIIGDQTGVGKGRQMAALIRWAVKRGEKPIFITQKADLFSDIYRDLVDVGSGDLVPFIFNSDGAMVDSNGNVVHKPLSASAMSKVFASGELPDSYDFAVLTYSQVNTGDAISQKEAEEAAKKSGTRAKKSKASKECKPTPKATFLRSIAKDNYLFLDESHTAAGLSNTGAYLQSILKSAKAATFASATFAKRPDTMPLYAIRTAMSQAKIEPEKLISIIEKGGVTLQEIMSRELTNAGQMVRRERDMSDVKTDWKTIDDPATVKSARENYDKTIQAFNAIIKFQNDFVKPKIDDLDQSLAIVAQSAGVKKGTDKMGVENVPFASKTYNYTKQLMLALKVDAIADEVEKEIKAGRHPVIALESTMESTIKDYSAGEVIKEPTFSASLLKGLDSVMQYTIKDEDGKETHARYAPSDLGKAGEEAYYNLQKLIRESTSDIFISPLDAIIERLHEKGYKVGELTGRNLYVERNENGEVVVKRRTDKDKKKMQRDFNSGNLDVLILNKSASTGISLHASEKFKDQRQRTMIIAQPLSDINDYMQMIGRIDRTGQVHRGYYINLGLPVPAENRFLMMLSTKLKSLNANTTTSQDSKSNEVEAPDLLNKYGSQVVVEYLRDNPEVYEKMGAPLKKGGLGSGKVQASELDEYKPQDDDARKITGYVALLSTKEQEDLYNDVVKRYNDLIQYLNDTGSNDLKINVMPLRAKTLEKRVSSEGIDPNGTNPFAKNAYVEKVEMDVLRKPMKAEEVRKTIDKLNKTSVDVTTDVIRKESDAKIASENARYENAREKALDDIQKQKEKIEKSKKLSDEEKVAAINSYITDTNNTIEERHDKNLKKITDNRDQLIRRLRMFDAGKSYLVPDNLESMTFDFASPAIFCGYKAKENKITASTTLAVFATLDSRRRIEIKLSDINALQSIDKMTMDNIDAARAITIDNWDSQIPTETRKEGYILTGNILQAIADSQDEYGGYTGHLVSYTDIDGNIHDGILMPDKWNTSLLKSSGAPLSARMEQIKRYEPIVSSDGKVTLNGSQWAEMYYLTVPKTKKDGAMYYENKVLLDASKGEFYPYRGNLRADIPAENIEGVVKELTKLGVKVRESNDVVQRNDLYRQGTGALTDSELSNANDPAGKMLGKPSRAKAQQKEFAKRERQRMADRAREVADILNLDNVEIVTDVSTLQGRRAKAKGFYSRDNGKIVIVVPNHVDIADIEQTVLHEAVAHYGLRKLFGSNFDTFINNVYNNADENVRREIVQLAAQHNWDFAVATEEYLASLAEKTNFEDMNASWWNKIKDLFLSMVRSIGLKGFSEKTLSDNELRYILWRSYENLKNPGRYRSIIDEARDMSMQNDLKVGNYSVQNSRNNVAEETDKVFYREAKEVEDEINNDWRDEYDKKLSKFSFKLTEAAQDAMRSVKILQDIIAKETSAPIRDDENVYWRENRLSSVNKYEQEYYNENYFKPIVTEIANLVKYGARYNDKGEDIINSDNDVLKYLIAKSGLERNQSKREVEAMNARKPYEDQIKELQKQVKKGEIKEEDANKEIAKLQEQADKAEMKKRVDVLHKDYSGLTELFQDKKDFDTLATSYVSDFEKKFDTKSLWNAINRATKETLRKAFVDGLISRESYENTAKMYKYYIPLRGWANDVASEAYNYKGSDNGSRKILQTAKGRTSLADNPISEIGRMMQDAIFQGNRNRMKQAVYNLAMNHDTSLLNIKRQWYQNMGTKDDPIWERVFPDLSSDMTADQVAEEVEDFESRMRELKKEGKATQSRKGLILRLHTTKREEAQHRISVAINGKEYNIFVNGSPRAAQAINGELNDVDRYGSAVAKVNRFLSQVYTSINPEFVVTNYQRDAGFAASIVASTEPLSYQKEWAKNMTIYNPITTGVYLNSLIKKAKTGNVNPNNKAERYMQEFLSYGGETGFTNMLSADDYKKQIKRDIKSINSVVSLPKAARAAVAFTERANTVFEDATRYATYVTSREQGRTIARSIRDAKEISLNFNTRGADGLPGDGFIYRFFRGLRRWMIFVNPSIQGLNKAGMAFRNHPLRSSMMIAGLPTLLGYALPAIMQAVVGGGDGDDDDKNVVESYKDLPKWVRRTNIAIPIGGNNFITIPLSYELRVSYGLGEMVWEYGEGMIDKDEVATETLSQLSDLLPISFSNGTVAQSISPSIARPLIDVIQNRNFYGKKIYNDSQFIEGYPEYMKAYAGTPKWLVKSTEVLNNVMPKFGADVSDKYTPGLIDLNPAMIDYLLSSYLGGLYNFPSKFGKTISMIWDEDMRDIQNVPIVSRNWKNSQSGNPYNSGDRYKTYMKEYDLSKQRFNGYKKEAKNDVPEFLKSLNDLLDTPSGKRMLMIDAYKRDGLDKLNRRIRDIDTYGNEKYEGEKDALTKRRDGLKEELINKLDSISDGTLDFVNGEWTRK